jgi:type 1 glutamine amidotransferase
MALAMAGLAWMLPSATRPAAAKEDAGGDDGFVSIFDGKSLKDWDGNPDFWRVEDGTITGETTAEKPTKGNTFIIWRGGELGDFELKADFKIYNHNSGIQYRSFEVPDHKWVVGGYQADFDGKRGYTGSIYGEKFRGMLAKRGEKTVIGDNHKPKLVGSVGNSDELQSHIKADDWNEYHIIVRGFEFTQKINGVTMAEMTDDDEQQRRDSGILALQLHAGPPMKVQFRNIRLKQAASPAKQSSLPSKGIIRPASMLKDKDAGGADTRKKIAFVAGTPSHGYAQHEHRAGCMLLAKELNESGLVRAEVYSGGWPQDDSVLDDADAIVIYADGGAKHPMIDSAQHPKSMEHLARLMHKGVGLVCLHFAVEVPKGPAGDALLNWIGGYFEPDWSVNPHWTADFKQLPDHPVSRGVRPFAINDEWYYHMRFRPGMDGIAPILTAVAPASTLDRKDGPHSGNPAVREAVKKGEPQHMAWACERADGGRGFGFTGGHFHWNWGDNDFRKVVLNAIVWSAKLEVPSDGVQSKTPTVEDLMANLDPKKIPKDFDPAKIQKQLDELNK